MAQSSRAAELSQPASRSTPVELGRTQRLALFFGISFAGSWALAGSYALLGGSWGDPFSRSVGVLYLMPPALAALVVQGALAKRPVAEPFGLRFPRSVWFLVGWVLPVVTVLLALVVAHFGWGLDVVTSSEELVDVYRRRVSPGQAEAFEQRLAEGGPPPPWALFLYAMLAGLTIDLLLSLAEELGWRGYLLHELEGGFWRRSLLIGLAWGIWYVPLVLLGHMFPEHRAAGAGLVVIWTLLAAPVLTYLRLRARTLFAAAVFRGTWMALLPVGQDLTAGSPDVLRPPHGLTGLVALALVLGGLALFDRFVSEEPLMGRRERRS